MPPLLFLARMFQNASDSSASQGALNEAAVTYNSALHSPLPTWGWEVDGSAEQKAQKAGKEEWQGLPSGAEVKGTEAEGLPSSSGGGPCESAREVVGG